MSRDQRTQYGSGAARRRIVGSDGDDHERHDLGEEEQCHADERVRPDAAVLHDREYLLATPSTAESIERVSDGILVKCTCQPNRRRDGQNDRERRGPERRGCEIHQTSDRRDHESHDREVCGRRRQILDANRGEVMRRNACQKREGRHPCAPFGAGA